MRFLAIGLAALVSSSAFAGVLSTTTSNNGSGGIFLDLTASASQNISILSFDTYFASVAGTNLSVEVYTRPGSYTGFTTSNAGWTLSQTATATSAGTTTLANLLLGSSINIAAGTTQGIYLQSITTGSGLRYTGTSAAPPQTVWNNSDLTLTSSVARVASAAFTGTEFTPRTFAGNVNYSAQPVPEPATMGALGIGAIALLRRRKASRRA